MGAAICALCIFYGPVSYYLFFLVLSTVTLVEFYYLLGMDGITPLKLLGVFNGVLIFSLSFLVEMHLISAEYYVLIFPTMAMIFIVKLYKIEHKPFTNIALTILGVIYVAVPFALLNIAAFSKGGYSWQLILGPLLLLWASDSGAYFFGRAFGRHKLFERVSPKKTWEGSLGGLALSMGMATLLSFHFLDLMLWEWLCLAAIIVIAGGYGDLVESLFKRSIAVKDSGRMIPGHGGFLDRFDSLIMAAPFVAAFLYLTQQG